jgi:hypothetical protein
MKSSSISSWILHRNIIAWQAPASLTSEWRSAGSTFNFKLSSSAFDSGGERNVFNLQWCDAQGKEDERTPLWVAKENKHIEREERLELEFHRKNLVTQAMAGSWAKIFSILLQQCSCVSPLPKRLEDVVRVGMFICICACAFVLW